MMNKSGEKIHDSRFFPTISFYDSNLLTAASRRHLKMKTSKKSPMASEWRWAAAIFGLPRLSGWEKSELRHQHRIIIHSMLALFYSPTNIHSGYPFFLYSAT